MHAAAKTVLSAVAVLLVYVTSASAALGEYDLCPSAGDLQMVGVSNAGCPDVAEVVAALAAAPADESASVLRAAGWRPLRAEASEDSSAFHVVATRGRAALHLRRPGAAPD